MKTSADQRLLARRVLTAKQYEAWEAVEIRGWTFRQIAVQLDVDHTTIRDRVGRARQILLETSRGQFPARALDPVEMDEIITSKQLAVVLLIQRDGATCYLCRNVFPASDLTVEHIVPIVAGGTNEPENLALACAPCNGKKGARFVSLSVSSGRPVYHSA